MNNQNIIFLAAGLPVSRSAFPFRSTRGGRDKERERGGGRGWGEGANQGRGGSG